MSLFEFQGIKPKIEEGCFIAPTASVIGNVSLGVNSSIWFGSVLRGDINQIIVGKNTNIQDQSTLHVTQEYSVLLGDNITIGHNVIVHGCSIGHHSLIGMGSILMDGVKVGENCLVAAGSLLSPNKEFPDKTLINGSPAKVIRDLNDQELEIYGNHYKNYLILKENYQKTNNFCRI